MPRSFLPTRRSRGALPGQPSARSRPSVRLLAFAAPILASAALSGCGSDDAPQAESSADPVQLQVSSVRVADDPLSPGQQTTLSMKVRNTGSNPVQDLIVTLDGTGETALAPADLIGRLPEDYPEELPSSVGQAAFSVDDAPGRYALAGGDQYDAGVLNAGEERTITWKISALRAGDHTLRYSVTGGLSGAAARATSGSGLSGTLDVEVRGGERGSEPSDAPSDGSSTDG